MIGLIILAVIIGIAGGFIYKTFIKGSSVRHVENTRPNARQSGFSQERVESLSLKDETGPMVYFANDNHGSLDREYRFNYKKVDSSWRAYILQMPDLMGRNSSGFSTHRMWDGDKPYVCWTKKVDSLRDIQTISKLWADNIQEYIATGKIFG